MNKRILGAVLLSGALSLSACSNGAGQEQNKAESGVNSDKISIVATSFHEYDWVNQIIGQDNDTFDVTLLMDNGVDLHSYEPSVEDISIISSADLFIYNGGPSHGWVEDILAEPMNEGLKAVRVMASLGDAVKNEVAVEGMQSGSAHDHEEHDHEEEVHDEHDHEEHDHEEEVHDEHDHEEHDHEEEVHDVHECDDPTHNHDTDDAVAANAPHEDEHVWLSLNNAMVICGIIEDEISDLDPANEAVYQANADEYINKLKALDESFEEAVASSPRDTLVFADRFPFLYLMQDYDVNYYAAFQGCSAETEANFETIVFLSDKVNELDINNLIIIDNGLAELAETVNNSSEDKDSEILELDSIQSVSREEMDAGVSYYSIMESNLEILKTALGE